MILLVFHSSFLIENVNTNSSYFNLIGIEVILFSVRQFPVRSTVWRHLTVAKIALLVSFPLIGSDSFGNVSNSLILDRASIYAQENTVCPTLASTAVKAKHY